MYENIIQTDSSHRVLYGNARFSLLENGMIRLEYTPEGVFDDRPTFRAISMPGSIPFDNIMETNDCVEMITKGQKIT